ncbi:MAG: hypothetical protein ACREOW_16340 [Thermodesulfobacteriota bacterium]
MHSRNQYLKQLGIEYLRTKPKKQRGGLLDEAQKRTGFPEIGSGSKEKVSNQEIEGSK